MGISQTDYDRIVGKFEKMAVDRQVETSATAARIAAESTLSQTVTQANSAVSQATSAAASARLDEENARHAVDVDELDLRHEFDNLVVEPEPTPDVPPETPPGGNGGDTPPLAGTRKRG